MSNMSVKIEDRPIWKEACDLAEFMYGKLSDFPEEEKWYTATKLRSATIDFMYFASLAVGNTNPVGREFDWINVRKNAAALLTVYRFAGRQKFIELEPEIMVRITKMLTKVDTIIAEAQENGERFRVEESKKDLKPWLEKYEIWKQIEQEKSHD
jgi:hypothetical protein